MKSCPRRCNGFGEESGSLLVSDTIIVMGKISATQVAGGLFKRALSVRRLRGARRLHRGQKTVSRARDDDQLKLYGELLPGGFLHYGFFDDAQTSPREISLNDIARAQLRYAELVLKNIEDGPVLDVGCGLGGMVRLLLERDLQPVALSPDAHQIARIQSHFPGVKTIEARFEDLPLDAHRGRYGTVLTAESLQYLDMEAALPLIAQILQSGGRWIACDYFRKAARENKSRSKSETWESFAALLEKHGLEVRTQRDITAHILPTLAYLHLWGEEIGRPVLNFSIGKIRRKAPGLHHLLEETLALMENGVERNLNLVDPKKFAANYRYLLLEIVVKSEAKAPLVEMNRQVLTPKNVVETNGNLVAQL